MKSQLKSLVRRPAISLVLLALLAAVTFGFVARAVEYLAVTKEVDRLSEYYRTIGYLSAEDESSYVTAGAKLLADSELVALHDAQRFCVGVLDGVYNADTGGYLASAEDILGPLYDYHAAAEVLFWGELVSAKYASGEDVSDGKDRFFATFQVKERLSGYPEYAVEGSTVNMIYTVATGEKAGLSAAADEMEAGRTYLVRACHEVHTNASQLTPRKAVPEGEWFLPDGTPAETVEALLAADAVPEHNRHAMMVDTSKDLSARPNMQESSRLYYLTDGRWLNAQDEADRAPVCVVHEEFAKARGLSLGDTITLTLRDMQVPYGYAGPDTTLADIEAMPSVTTTFTIVGLYSLQIKLDSVDSLIMYIPDSCMPAAYDAGSAEKIWGGSYSFVLRSPEDKAAFVEWYEAPLAQEGLTLHWIENGGETFATSTQPILRSAEAGALIFAVVQLAVLALAAFLYLRQHRREFAICRALGVPAGKTALWQAGALTLPGAVGIALGGALAWRYALEQAQKTLSTLSVVGQTVEPVTLPLWYLAALCALSLAVLLALTGIGLFVSSCRSVLATLQAGRGRRTAKPTPSPIDTVPVANLTMAAEVPVAVSPATPAAAPSVGVSTRGAFRGALTRFLLHKTGRGLGKSLLAVAVAAVFMVALGWIGRAIVQTGQTIDDMYANTVVTGSIAQSNSVTIYGTGGGIVPERAVQAILETDFVTGSRLVAADSATAWVVNEDGDQGAAISVPGVCGVKDPLDLNRSGEASGDTGVITYAPEWDGTLFADRYDGTTPYPMILPATLMEEAGLDYGSEVGLTCGSWTMVGQTGETRLTFTVAGSYTGSFDGLGSTVPDAPLLVPLSTMQRAGGNRLYYSVAEFMLDPAKNRELDALRIQAQELLDRPMGGQLALNFIIRDEELRQVVAPLEKNLILMEALYPVAQGVAVLVACAVTLLLLLQEAKTAAILRVLGVSARSTRRTLGAGQLALCGIGILVGILLALVLGKWDLQLLLCAALYLLGALIGTLVGCRAVTNKKPLELLQVKE